MAKVIFRTPHGSHLYGMAHAESDHDEFVVTTGSGRTRHKQSGNIDRVTMPLDRFLENAYTGSHQSVEALFSPYKEWGEAGEAYRPMLENMRVGGPLVLAKYRRTIKAFALSGDFKKRRHAIRLWQNMQDLRVHGWFNPAMSAWQVEVMSQLALVPDDGGGSLYSLLRTGKSPLWDL